MDNDLLLNTGGGGSNVLPDYYLGCLLMYDEFSEDTCRWIVYDGASRVRCPSRRDAINYITERHQRLTGTTLIDFIVDARISLNHAITALDKAADNSSGVEQLYLRRLAVSLKPTLVEIDNITLST